jgi:hypothetical protein
MPSLWSTAVVINGLIGAIRADSQTVVTGKLGNAVAVTNNPTGAVYLAALPETHLGIQGSIVATSANQLGTEFTVNFANLPAEGGPFCE